MNVYPTLDDVIRKHREKVQDLRSRKSEGPNSGMDAYIWKVQADAIELVINDLTDVFRG